MKKSESKKTNYDILQKELEKLEDINMNDLPESTGSEFTDGENNFRRLIDNSSADWLDEPACEEVLQLEGSVDPEDRVSFAADMMSAAINFPNSVVVELLEKKGIKTTQQLREEEVREMLQGGGPHKMN